MPLCAGVFWRAVQGGWDWGGVELRRLGGWGEVGHRGVSRWWLGGSKSLWWRRFFGLWGGVEKWHGACDARARGKPARVEFAGESPAQPVGARILTQGSDHSRRDHG